MILTDIFRCPGTVFIRLPKLKSISWSFWAAPTDSLILSVAISVYWSWYFCLGDIAHLLWACTTQLKQLWFNLISSCHYWECSRSCGAIRRGMFMWYPRESGCSCHSSTILLRNALRIWIFTILCFCCSRLFDRLYSLAGGRFDKCALWLAGKWTR